MELQTGPHGGRDGERRLLRHEQRGYRGGRLHADGQLRLGAKNVVIRNAKMLTRDAFWNSENVTVYDSHIYGEYLGWNAKNLTLVNCTVESLQGMCYAENLVMENCRLLNTTLAFEYSSVRADILGRVDSVKNPVSGKIVADDFGEIIVESDKVDPAATTIARRGEGRE